MKTLSEHITTTLNESADKAYSRLFGKTIKLGARVIKKLNDVGLSWEHKFDTFVIDQNGYIEYRNERLFMGQITGNISKYLLNRIISPTETKLVISDNQVTSNANLDMSMTPYFYIRALLNALVYKNYEIKLEDDTVILYDIDYTKGDYEKDKKEEA